MTFTVRCHGGTLGLASGRLNLELNKEHKVITDSEDQCYINRHTFGTPTLQGAGTT